MYVNVGFREHSLSATGCIVVRTGPAHDTICCVWGRLRWRPLVACHSLDAWHDKGSTSHLPPKGSVSARMLLGNERSAGGLSRRETRTVSSTSCSTLTRQRQTG